MLKGIGFELQLASPPEYCGLVAEIYFDGKFVALVNQERGQGCFEVETPGIALVETEVARRVELQGFAASLKLACQRLSEK